MGKLRILAVLSLLVIPRAEAHDPPAAKVVIKINSSTIGERLEARKEYRPVKIQEAQKLIAQTVAAKLNSVFSFIQWQPVHQSTAKATLTITIVEKKDTQEYSLQYMRSVPGEREVSGPVDWGTGDLLFESWESPTLGNAVSLGNAVADKVASQLGVKKRPHVMSAFLSRIPLCQQKPDPQSDHSFTVHVPLEKIKAARESTLEIEFWAKPKTQNQLERGLLKLTPLRAYSGADASTRGLFDWFDFPTIGELKRPQWNDDIYPLFDKQFDRSFIYMYSFRSTEDSTTTIDDDTDG